MILLNGNIYRKDLKRYRGSAIAWSLTISALTMIGMAFYPVLMDENILKQLTAFFETSFMKNMMAALGATPELLTNVLGYYCTRNATFIILLGAFFSIMLASKILSLEEREKTAEFLMTKPVTRIEILGSKVAVFLTYLVMLNGILLLIGFISLELFKGESDYRISAYLIHAFYAFLAMLTFGAIGLFLSLIMKRGRSTSNISIGIVVGGFVIDTFSNLTKSADKFGYISPFKYVDTGVLRPDYALVGWRVLYFLGLSSLLFFIALWIYKKKDILL